MELLSPDVSWCLLASPDVCLSLDRMNLWEVADFLKKNGVINAINLDGGGSSTYVVEGSLASCPSDHWSARPSVQA